MNKYGEYKQIKAANDAARYTLDLIGRPQSTTSQDIGKLHKLRVSATILFQERDGAKNYHEDKRLNAALSQAVAEDFGKLRTRAEEIMKSEETSALSLCKFEVEELLGKIKDAEQGEIT